MTTTRRTFLKVVGAGALAASAPLPGCGFKGPVEVGNAADFAEGVTKVPAAEAPLLIGRDEGGLYAMTAVCAHLGCDLTDEDGKIGGGKIVCAEPCGHNSEYDYEGAVLKEPDIAPSTHPLQHWELAIDDDGLVTVQVGTEVPASTRVAVA